jgi:hypothetical protein
MKRECRALATRQFGNSSRCCDLHECFRHNATVRESVPNREREGVWNRSKSEDLPVIKGFSSPMLVQPAENGSKTVPNTALTFLQEQPAEGFITFE